MSQLKLALVLLLLIHIAPNPYSPMVTGAADGATVGGAIRQNTVWTKEKSPYILEDDITIRPGITLRIQEGVVVDFSLWSMIVNGKLRATGNNEEHVQFHFTTMPLTSYDDARIVFTEKIEPYQNLVDGSRLEYVDIYCSENTVNHGLIEGGTLKIDHVTIYDSEPHSKYYTVKTNGSVTNSLFVRVTRAVKLGEGDIVENIFINSSSSVITITDGLVRNNLINGGRKGIVVKNALVLNNTLTNLVFQGISIVNNPTSYASLNTSDKPRPQISNNLIINCGGDAIYISGNIRPTMTFNVLYENNNGIYFNENEFYNDERPRIYYNIFYNNENNVIFDREDPRIEIKLQNNWWGTNDTLLIEDKIYYENDDARLTAALYQPIRSEPPSFLPKIPYELKLSRSAEEVEVNDVIPVSGRVYPPLEGSRLTLRCIGPEGQIIDRVLITDVYGIFMDELTPDSVGTWSISVESEENLLLESQSVFTQVLVTNTESAIEAVPSPETIIENEAPLEDTVSTDVVIETDDDVTPIPSEPSEGEVTEIQYETDALPVSQTEKPASPREPFIYGFIPSIVTLVMLIALYVGVNGFKLR